jgi:hypothetical protein
VLFERSLSHNMVPVNLSVERSYHTSRLLSLSSCSSPVKTLIIIYNFQHLCRSRNSSVIIATDYGLNDRIGVRIPGGAENFFFSTPCPDWLCGTPSLLSNGNHWGVKRPGREADHSPLSSAKVKECEELYLHSPNTPSWRGA